MAFPGPLRDFFTRNLGYKIIALVLALLLWFDVTTDETAVIDYPVPLQIAVEGNDMIITNRPEVPSQVEVTFTGTGKELLRLDKDQLSVQKEVAGGENDTTVMSLDLTDVQKPADLAVSPIAITPSEITVVTDRFIERTVPLQPVGFPEAPPGHRVEGLEVEPRRVRIRGVTSEVRPIGSLALDLSQIRGVEGHFDERLEIAVPETLKTVTVSPDTVHITGDVVAEPPIAEP